MSITIQIDQELEEKLRKSALEAGMGLDHFKGQLQPSASIEPSAEEREHFFIRED